MAKGIAINGQLRGKLGGVVYYRSNGQQISRARAENVSNPNTQPQRIQRMIMATVMQAYSLTKEITDHSFEGIKYKQDSMAFFQRVNANKLRAQIGAVNPAFTPSFTAPKLQALIPNGYTISRGSLTPVLFYYMDGDAGAHYPIIGNRIDGEVSMEDISLSKFMQVLGAVPGDMVTLVWLDGDTILYSLTDGENERENVKYVTMRYIRIKFKDSYTTEQLSRGILTTEGGEITGVNTDLFDITECSNLDKLAEMETVTVGEHSFVQFPNVDAHAIGAIRSRRQDGEWKRSICEMRCNPGYHYGLSYENGLLAWENNTNELGSGDWLLNDKKEGVNP